MFLVRADDLIGLVQVVFLLTHLKFYVSLTFTSSNPSFHTLVSLLLRFQNLDQQCKWSYNNYKLLINFFLTGLFGPVLECLYMVCFLLRSPTPSESYWLFMNYLHLQYPLSKVQLYSFSFLIPILSMFFPYPMEYSITRGTVIFISSYDVQYRGRTSKCYV